MKIQEVTGAQLWAELRKQIDLIKPKAVAAANPGKKSGKSKRAKSGDLVRATGKLTNAVSRLKARSPIKPVVMARPAQLR